MSNNSNGNGISNYDSNSEKKVWRFTQVSPDPHEKGQFYAVQELVGAWLWDEEEKESYFEPAETPRSTRVTLMKMDDSGRAWNVHSEAYNNRDRRR